MGVEVKYTEGEYPYGKQEQRRMFSDASPYHHVHARSGMYVVGSIPTLRTERFKQGVRETAGCADLAVFYRLVSELALSESEAELIVRLHGQRDTA